ncbi:hypothetical protein PIB30_081767 [Stylosanthes scabra]|uniref:Putative plant transposon protein domain-containing protein n=1 Tax=Stylosanthes scabra TaxID=79078 RepID=A0ABU6ZQC7_9FABA|nr:hypothetical protein [Stylosanthes scabra]
MEEGEATDEGRRRGSGGDGDGHKVFAVSEEKRVSEDSNCEERKWRREKRRTSGDDGEAAAMEMGIRFPPFQKRRGKPAGSRFDSTVRKSAGSTVPERFSVWRFQGVNRAIFETSRRLNRFDRPVRTYFQNHDRKRKGKAESSSSQVPRFKTLFHEAHFKSKLSARKVLPELIIQVDESILDPCGFKIQQRKWERFTKLIQAVGHLMVKEFYANAWELNKEKRKPYTYTTMVRGKDISFAPNNIKRMLKLRKDPLPNAASCHERKANKDYRLEHVLEDLCIEGADWVRHKDG